MAGMLIKDLFERANSDDDRAALYTAGGPLSVTPDAAVLFSAAAHHLIG